MSLFRYSWNGHPRFFPECVCEIVEISVSPNCEICGKKWPVGVRECVDRGEYYLLLSAYFLWPEPEIDGPMPLWMVGSQDGFDEFKLFVESKTGYRFLEFSRTETRITYRRGDFFAAILDKPLKS